PTSAWVTARASTTLTLRRHPLRLRHSFLEKATRAQTHSSLRANDQHVLEVLAGSTAGAAVHVAPQPVVEPKPGAFEDRGIQVATIVDDDADRRSAAQHHSGVRKRHGDPLAVRVDRRARGSRFRGAELELTRVVEAEQL